MRNPRSADLESCQEPGAESEPGPFGADFMVGTESEVPPDPGAE
jgi:hypothetical protein